MIATAVSGRFAALCALCLVMVWAGAAAAQDLLSGRWNGVEGARGMALEFAASGEGYEVVWRDRDGSQRPFAASALATGAEAQIETDEGEVFLLFTARGAGLRMSAIPMTEDGGVDLEQARAMIFLREGVSLPEKPARYLEPPQAPGGTIDPEAFVASYAFWPPEGVAYGYGMVRDRYRTLIGLHSTVQADILWKLCQTGVAPAIQAEALRGQGVSCKTVLSRVGGMMRDGAAFDRFKRDAEKEKAQLAEAIRCSLDYRRNDPACKTSGARVAKRAVSMETVGIVLSRY